jgi:hypothetical protein
LTKLLTAVSLLLSFPIGPLGEQPDVPTVETGILSQYAIGVMPGVVDIRQEWGQLPLDLSGIDGFVAAWDCERIGETALLSIDGGEWITVMVSDCSGHESTTEWMISNSVLVEMSGELAEEYGVVCLCPIPGRVVWID